MQRILHIIDWQAPADMLRQMRMLRLADEPAVCLGQTPQCETVSAPLTKIHVPFGWQRLAAGRLRCLAKDFSLLHVWSVSAGQAALAATKNSGGRIVLSLPHVRQLDETVKLYRAGGNSIAAITVPTSAAAQRLSAAGIDPAKITVLHPPVVIPDDMQARRRRVRDELAISDDCILMAATSEMTRNAGHRFASWSHAIMRQMRANYRLIFHGCGRNEDRIRFFANTTGYEREVFFTANKYDYIDVIAACDIATFFAERDCGVTDLLTAMVAGKPIVAAATDDISEIAPQEQCAILAAVGDPRQATAAILRLDRESQLGEKLADQAKRRATQIADLQSRQRILMEIYQRAMQS